MKNISKLCLLLVVFLMTSGLSVNAQSEAKLKSFEVNPGDTVNFESPVMVAKGKFSGVIVDFEQEESADDVIEFEIRFKDGLKFTEWVSIGPDGDHQDEEGLSDTHYDLLINTNLTDKYQYRVKIKAGPDSVKPELKGLKFTFINAEIGETVDIVARSSSLIAGIEPSPVVNKVEVISRSKWGANDSLNYYNKGSEPDDGYEPHDEITHVVETENGRTLKWPYEYAEKIRMIVIHHTASTKDLDDPEQAIRNIQYYHAVKRGWGDIGYNYLIDQEGNVYEGRKGGEMVVGGHAVPVNKTSIGIAVLGNFQEQQVPKAVAESIIELAREKASRYSLDLNDDVNYKGETYPVLGGHSDYSPTACPGENLYSNLSSFRYIAMKGETKSISYLQGQKYAFLDTDPFRDFAEIDPFESKIITVKLKNVGTSKWNSSNTYLKLVDDSDMDVSSSIRMVESSVSPGDNATFKIKVEAGLEHGYRSLEFVGYANGVSTGLPVFVPVYVTEPDLEYSVDGGDSERLILQPGETKQLSFKIKNKGEIDWNRNGYQVYVDSYGSSTLLQNRVRLGSSEISKGESETVTLTIKAPTKSGTYRESYVPMIEGVSAFEGDSIDIQVRVQSDRDYDEDRDAIYLQSGRVSAPVRTTSVIAFELKNETDKTWDNDMFTVAILGGRRGLGTNIFGDRWIANAPVRPGETAVINIEVYPNAYSSFNYKMRVFANGKLANYRKTEDLQVVGSANRSGSRVSLNSSSKSTLSDEVGPDIRVHISNFTQKEVDLTGDDFKVKVDSKNLGTTDFAKVVKSGSNVKVFINGESHIGSTVRIEGEEDEILTLETFENRPSWNRSLNDNQFRDTMEFRVLDNSLVAINELPIELYLRGLAEVSNTTDPEKIKTIVVAARSYAYHYITDDDKFPGKPWDLDDSPERSQKYLGYGFEKRSSNVTLAIRQTAGKVVTYKNKAVKVPYFNQSDGKTRSAKDVWGWNDTPYLVAVNDKYCNGSTLLGHGVGISGCGADGMAKAGKDHEEIIEYFLKGVSFKYVYAGN